MRIDLNDVSLILFVLVYFVFVYQNYSLKKKIKEIIKQNRELKVKLDNLINSILNEKD
jgi:hypothetical protein